MDERVIKFRVGVMVLATLIIAGIMMLVFGNLPGTLQRTITVFVKFPQAPGVTQDTPVRKSGILIGRVTDVNFDTDSGVIVTMRINESVKLRRDETCMINSSLLGDAVLQFVPSSDAARSAALLADGDYIQGRVAADPLQLISNLEGTFGQAVVSVSAASDDLAKLAQSLNGLVQNNEAQITRIIGKTERALDGIQRAMGNMESLLGDKEIRDNIRYTIREMPELIKNTRGIMTEAHDMVASLGRNLKNVEGLTRPLGERGDSIIGRLDSGLGRLDAVLDQFVTFGNALNRPDSTFGRLMNDPEFYGHLSSAVKNIDQITKDLKPILGDVRAFSDKIARHPEVLGVRGAIRQSPGIK